MKSAVLMFTLLIAPLVAQAEIESTYTDSSHFGAYVVGMPDLDQRRDTPNWSEDRNEGRMYCGPAASANLLSYLVREGYPGVSAPTTDLEPVIADGLIGRELLRASIVDASFGPYATSEQDLATKLWPSIPDESLTIVDRGFSRFLA